MTKALLLLSRLLILSIAPFTLLASSPQYEELRAAEHLWRTRRIAEARQRLEAIHRQGAASPAVSIRLAAIALMRGECSTAEIYAATALLQPLRHAEAARAHLIAGQCAALRGNQERAQAEWAAIDPSSSDRALASVLRGENALRRGDAAEASRHYQIALGSPLPGPWSALVHFRLALIEAFDKPTAATRHLEAIPSRLAEPDPETRPFLPLPPAQIMAQARYLRAILLEPEGQRAQLLGQQMLGLELYHLAMLHFARVPSDMPGKPQASAYAAYARWQIGQREIAIAHLRELTTRYPGEPIIASFLETATLESGNLDAAQAVLDAVEARQPGDPTLALVRSDILAARHEYEAAVAERRRARDLAPSDLRGRFAIALAQQHLHLTYDLCGTGVSAAREATRSARNEAAAWQSLAAALYHCRAYREAAEAARNGLQIAPQDAALTFFLGAALWESGNQAGREYLINAADLEPASEWRKRAEQLLGW
jgi:hypothetical protein